MNPVMSDAMAATSIAIQRPNEMGFENWAAQCSARFFLVAIPNFAAKTWIKEAMMLLPMTTQSRR
jgi:hypothetical protein